MNCPVRVSVSSVRDGLRREAAVEIPAWVIEPEDQADFRVIAADEDEYAAAAFLRRKLAMRRALSHCNKRGRA